MYFLLMYFFYFGVFFYILNVVLLLQGVISDVDQHKLSSKPAYFGKTNGLLFIVISDKAIFVVMFICFSTENVHSVVCLF